ncbi:hypothetical protein YC2023_062966 [Brassica napus]
MKVLVIWNGEKIGLPLWKFSHGGFRGTIVVDSWQLLKVSVPPVEIKVVRRSQKPDGAFAQSRRGFHVDLGTREKDVGIESDRFQQIWIFKSEGWSDSDRGISCTFGALLSVDQFLVCSFEILKPAPSSSCIALKKGSFKGGRPVVI